MSMKKLIELDDFEGIKKAVIAGEDVNSTDRSGATALMRAIVKNVRILAKAGIALKTLNMAPGICSYRSMRISLTPTSRLPGCNQPARPSGQAYIHPRRRMRTS